MKHFEGMFTCSSSCLCDRNMSKTEVFTGVETSLQGRLYWIVAFGN